MWRQKLLPAELWPLLGHPPGSDKLHDLQHVATNFHVDLATNLGCFIPSGDAATLPTLKVLPANFPGQLLLLKGYRQGFAPMPLA